MKKYYLLIILAAMSLLSRAQLDSVIVETYYISDSIDATNTIGGILEPGSVTYRIYVDLIEGSILKKIYGDENHPLLFSSTESFFNNSDRGKVLGFDLNDNKIDENTSALDTWITLGMATDDHMGILKGDDPDGSFVGGDNNDGGSSEIAGGLLVNEDPTSGIPITVADGLIEPDSIPDDFFAFGFSDTSIFGGTNKNIFYSEAATLRSETGLQGPASGNRILVAQLTTRGDLSFRLNIEVVTSDGQTIFYVADEEVLLENEMYSSWLTYPFKSGCTDPHYLEFDNTAVKDDNSCINLIVLGCMDPAACNFDPDANFNVRELCCYPPDKCDNRDISIVCPGWSGTAYLSSGTIQFNISPNPVTDFVRLDIEGHEKQDIYYKVFDLYGNPVAEGIIPDFNQSMPQLNLSFLRTGMYLLKLDSYGDFGSLSFIKE